MGAAKMKNISVIGIGRLGLCFALTLERAGYNALGCDLKQDYVDSVNDKTFFSREPLLNRYLKEALVFRATTSFAKTIEHSNLIFVTVRTESEANGRYDVSQVESVVASIQQLGPQENKKHLVICSNVNPGYSDTVAERLKELNWEVSYNPETVAQGTILINQSNPDCVYVGSDTDELADEIKEVYKNICDNSPSIHCMDRLGAELTKVSLNCFLTVKISFANMVGNLATKMGVNPEKVLRAVGSDQRINNKFFKYGFGWGGPCFPRDTRAFIRNAEQCGINAHLVKAAGVINKEHLEFQVEKFILEYDTDEPIIFDGRGQALTGAAVFEGVTYKKGTTIIEESQQLAFAAKLASLGYEIIIIDHLETINKVKEVHGDIFVYEEII